MKNEKTVFPKSFTLRVGSYNIKCGASMIDFDMSLIAKDIKSLSLDVVGLQEIDNMTARAGGRDVIKLLAQALGYPYYRFTKSIDYQGGEYGTAIVSRYPIVDFRSETLPHAETADPEQRAAGIATLDVNGETVQLVNTHMSLGESSARKAQFERIAQIVENSECFVITGDFNTFNVSEFSSIPNIKLVNAGKYPTFYPASFAIDEIVLGAGWSIVSSGMKDAEGHSDHNMLWAELEYTKTSIE